MIERFRKSSSYQLFAVTLLAFCLFNSVHYLIKGIAEKNYLIIISTFVIGLFFLASLLAAIFLLLKSKKE